MRNAPSTPTTMSKQQATLSKLRSTLSKQHSTQTATMSNDPIVKFRPFDKVECCFDVVERIVQLVAFDNVAWILLLVWTGLNCTATSLFARTHIVYNVIFQQLSVCCIEDLKRSWVVVPHFSSGMVMSLYFLNSLHNMLSISTTVM